MEEADGSERGGIRSALPLGSLIAPSGDEVELPELEGKVIGLYFAANWYPKCEAFTPALAAAYQQLRARGAGFEVVFVSCDEDGPSFERFHRAMPWPAVPFGDLPCKKSLSDMFQVEGIPRLVVLAPGGAEVVCPDAVELVHRYGDPAFPFTPARVAELEADERSKFASQTLEKLFSVGHVKNGSNEQLLASPWLRAAGSHREPGGEDGGALLLGARVRAVRQVHREAGRHLRQPEGQVAGIRGGVHPHGQGRGRVRAVARRHAVAGAAVRRRAVAGAGQVLRRAGDPDAGGDRAGRQDGDQGREEPGEPLLRHGVPVHGGAGEAAAGAGGRAGQGVRAVAAPRRAPARAERRLGEVGRRAVRLLRVRRAGARLGVPVHRLRLRDTPPVRPGRGRRRRRGSWSVGRSTGQSYIPLN
ncbi:uncharacterized protein [Triticum aestivum]|uniref:uncharacterized protein isoform X1 n=1 Tax=Triticum aestivum TaxID=4565 RepID=UPI001D012A76|nr:uncharacterized protein LOC123062291 isoform X1 [Triticum aestivum]